MGKIIYVDIDETICYYDKPLKDFNYALAKPNHEAIELVNEMYDLGNTIIYWTARGTVTGIDWYDLTESQFKEWGVKYHDLRMGKPAYDLFICDKTKTMEELL
tara:strand:+ start:464 stop:772 length:309 start_codon:yes stop_codon:yes gene_type:complete